MLFCADCGHKMYVTRRKGIRANKNSYNCGGYRSRKRNPDACATSHYICKPILEGIILEDLQRVTRFAQTNEIKFLKQVMECNSKETEKMLSSKKKELAKAKRRVDELNLLFKKIYEDNATNKLSDGRFAMLSSDYDAEQEKLQDRIDILITDINSSTEKQVNFYKFLILVKKYTEISELTYEVVREFIDKIIIYETDKEAETRKIDIYYNFIGIIQG